MEKHGGAGQRPETHKPGCQATRTFCGARDRDLQPQDQGSDAEGSHRQISRGVGEDRKRLEARSRYLERRQVGAGSGMSAFARRRGDRMKRREFITLLGGAAVSWPLAARAQHDGRVRRIGVLMSAAIETDQQAGVTVFLDVLHQLGWIDGHNVRVEIRWARGDPAEARRAAEELVALPADVIMVTGQLGLEALLRVTHSVPIVFNSVIDPVGSGYVDSLAR